LLDDNCAVRAAEPAQRDGGKASAGQPCGQHLAAAGRTAGADDHHVVGGQLLEPLAVAAINRRKPFLNDTE
jgi:hypothetical protein